MYGNISVFSLTILNVFSLEASMNILKSDKKKNIVIASFIVLVLLLSISKYNSHRERLSDRWSEVGKTELSPVMLQASSWLMSHTNVNDVILSNNENSFALNSLTGRKTLLNRRTHMSMFLDVDKNMIDGALILYGNDSKKRASLLKERKIKYLYWDINWIRLEYTIQNGKIANVFDPITLIYSEEKEKILNENNISYVKMHTWLDPAAKGEDIIQQDIIYIFPYKFDEEQPWNPDLNNHLKEVWNLKDQNNKSIAKIFEVIDYSKRH